MAYTPINWQTGDTITADKLNKMDNGWGYVTGSPTELFSETVTTSGTGMYRATLNYSDIINADTITVTFDGTEYTCPRIVTSNGYFYGGYSEQGPVFTEYPFAIMSMVDSNWVFTETASTHTITVTAAIPSMQTSEDFRKAVGNPGAFEISLGVTTFAEANEAFLSGKMVYVLEATSTSAYQYQVIYVDISRYTMSALEANGVNVNLRTFSASSADGVLTDD